METAKQAVNYVSETIQGATAGVSKEANKEVAKDSNVNVGTRYVDGMAPMSREERDADSAQPDGRQGCRWRQD